jgi:hypothetical protein
MDKCSEKSAYHTNGEGVKNVPFLSQQWYDTVKYCIYIGVVFCHSFLVPYAVN